MAKVLVSLIGDQTAPNIFVIRDERFRDVDRHLFISTEQMQRKGRVAQIRQALDLPEERVRVAIVPADELGGILGALDALRLDPADDYHLNLTSGTKIMSVGLYAFFTKKPFRSTIFYVPMGRRRYREIYPLADGPEYELTHQINLQEYLGSYGILLQSDGLNPKSGFPFGYTDQIRQWYLEADRGFTREGRPFHYYAQAVRERLNRQRKEGKMAEAIKWSDTPRLGDFLEEIGFAAETAGLLNRREIDYLTGGWFEEWAYELIRTQLGLPPGAIGTGVEILQDRLVGKYANNEFDLVFFYRDTLYVVECKSGMGFRFKETRELFENTVYRLAALRWVFGRNVHASVLTLSDRLREGRQRKRKKVFAERAALMNISLLDRDDLAVDPAVWVARLVGDPTGLFD